jgi:hypothetical protein
LLLHSYRVEAVVDSDGGGGGGVDSDGVERVHVIGLSNQSINQSIDSRS